jgi:RES domain-containing protein
VETVDRELARSLARAGMSSAAARPRSLATIRVRLTRVLDLTDPAMLERLGVTREGIQAEDPALPRAIGEAAHRLGYEAVLAPSATGSGRVLAVFLDNLAAGSTIEVEAVAEGYRPSTQEPSVQGPAGT